MSYDMTIYDIAEMLSLSPAGVRSLVKRGTLPEPYRLNSRVYRWSRQEVEDAIRQTKSDDTVSSWDDVIEKEKTNAKARRRSAGTAVPRKRRGGDLPL